MRKVIAGQPLKIPAATFNSMLDAAEDLRARRMAQGALAQRPDTKADLVLVCNQSGADCDQFDVLGIGGVAITPYDNPDEFASRFVLNGILPTSNSDQKFCVLQEPIAAGEYGIAMVSGITPVYMYGSSADQDKTAGIEAGQVYLKPGGSGAQIVYEEPTVGNQDHLALIRFPFGGGGGIDATVRYASTANVAPFSVTASTITFSTPPSLDGFTPSTGDLVLLKNQSSAAQNGIWKVGTGNVWTREGTLTSGMVVAIRQGLRNASALYVLRNEGTIVPGSTPLTFSNRAFNEYMSVKAAGSTKATPCDGQTIAAGERILVVSGSDFGAWEYDGTNWAYLDIPQCVGVRFGPTYGLLTLFLNNVGSGYTIGQAVWG